MNPPAIDIETLDRVCRGVASIQEGNKVRAYVSQLATVAHCLAINTRGTTRYKEAKPAFTVRVTVDEVLRLTSSMSDEATINAVLTYLEKMANG
jgi:hypothetical protein